MNKLYINTDKLTSVTFVYKALHWAFHKARSQTFVCVCGWGGGGGGVKLVKFWDLLWYAWIILWSRWIWPFRGGGGGGGGGHLTQLTPLWLQACYMWLQNTFEFYGFIYARDNKIHKDTDF